MGHFSDYEADQSRLYNAHHFEDLNSQSSKNKVRKIWQVTGILSIVTIVEVLLGLYSSGILPKLVVNIIFIGLTILKAAYIVNVFMHLGDERKNIRMSILIPLTLFFWFILAFLMDGDFWLKINQKYFSSPEHKKIEAAAKH